MSFAPETGAAVALRAQGDGARGVRDGRVSWPIPEGAVDLYLLLDNDAPCWRLLSALFGRVSTDVSASGRLMVIFLFFQRNRLCVCDVRPWKGIVELKGAEVAAATVAPAVARTCERRVRKAGPSCGGRLDRF